MDFSSYLNKAIDYNAYRALINDLLAEGKTSGNDHSEFMVGYTKMNVQRMNRLDKTLSLTDELKQVLQGLKNNYIFLVITEAWCGDASQIVPLFNKMALESESKIDLKLVFRDENLDLMDKYLTNGGRAIPKLVVLEKNTLTEISNWGPRPKLAQDLMNELKADGSLDMYKISEQLHAWYAKDRTLNTQIELSNLLVKSI